MAIKTRNPINGEISLGIHIGDRNDLIEAMRFKSENIKTHVDPKIFEDVADALENSVEVVRCKDCKNCRPGRYGIYCSLVDFVLNEDDYCSRGVKKEE